MDGFCEGYKFFCKNAGTTYAAFEGDKYVQSVVEEIEKLTQDMNQFDGFKTATNKLKGDIAEFWHGGTFNINAAVNGSKNRAVVDRSHDLGSPDIRLSSGETYGSKYDKDYQATAKEQATTYYQKYKSRKRPSSYEEWQQENQVDSESVSPNDPLYEGQYRLVPSDQYNAIKAYLLRKIRKESSTRPEQVKRYQDTLELLETTVKDKDGNSSIPLSKKQAEDIAQIAKEGGFDPADFGLTTEELIHFKHILQQSLHAGVSAATISLVLKVAPEIIKAIHYLIERGELNVDQFRSVGFAALSGSATGFVRGSVSAAITTSCKAGIWDEALKTVDPAVVGTITVVVMDTMKNAFSVATGSMTRRQLADELVRELFVSACSLSMGSAVQGVIAELPVLGYMIGSFVGSVLGSFAYSAGYTAIISFCVDTGFTMFGAVEQNYELPDEVLKEIGLEIFEDEQFEPEWFVGEEFIGEEFCSEESHLDLMEMTFLRRGVIGVRKIGYVF